MTKAETDTFFLVEISEGDRRYIWHTISPEYRSILETKGARILQVDVEIPRDLSTPVTSRAKQFWQPRERIHQRELRRGEGQVEALDEIATPANNLTLLQRVEALIAGRQLSCGWYRYRQRRPNLLERIKLQRGQPRGLWTDTIWDEVLQSSMHVSLVPLVNPGEPPKVVDKITFGEACALAVGNDSNTGGSAVVGNREVQLFHHRGVIRAREAKTRIEVPITPEMRDALWSPGE